MRGMTVLVPGCKAPDLGSCLHGLRGELLLAWHRWVEESSAYMAGLAGMSDVTAMVRQHRDRMLVRIMVDALQKRVEGFRMAGKDPQRRSMQLVADAWALSQALPALDDHTLVCTRCVASNAFQ